MSSPPFKLEGDILLRAGAGAGKTTTLIRHFFSVVEKMKESEKRWPQMVLTTFTRKATQEIRERLLQEALRREDQEFFKYINNHSLVHISTIHGVLMLFLVQYCDRVGLSPDFKVVDETSLERRQKETLRKVLQQHPESLILLEEYSFTELLEMIESWREQQVLSETTRWSFENIQNDLDVQLVKLRSAYQHLQQQAALEPLTPAWKEYLQKWDLLHGELHDSVNRLVEFFENKPAKPRFSAKSPISATFNESVENWVQAMTDFFERTSILKFANKYEELSQSFFNLAKEYSKRWTETQKKLGQISMGDLERVSARILKLDPATGEEFAKNWDYWMIDEYQDTSPLQVFLLQHLKGGKSSFVVGDPQQSIYLFRGARSEVFIEKQNEVQRSGQVQTQLTNYRSRAEVLHCINHLMTGFQSMSVGSTLSRVDDPACVIYPVVPEENGMAVAAVSRLKELQAQNIPLEKICILSRSHKNLMEIAKLCREQQIPIYLNSGRALAEKREILDALQILRFLDNPHDNINFVALLRSPWFYLSDQHILSFCQGHSYWLTAQKSKEESIVAVIQKLSFYLHEKNQKGDLSIFRKILWESGLLVSSFRADPSGQSEARLWRLIRQTQREVHSAGFSLAEWIEKLQQLSEDPTTGSSDAAAVIEPARVQMMTIHAAKGLQFPHVILAGADESSKSSPLKLFTFSELEKAWTLGLRDPETAERVFAGLALDVKEDRKKRDQEEFQRVMYVALTRAQESLTLVAAGGRSTRNGWLQNRNLDLSEGLKKETGFQYEVRTQIPALESVVTPFKTQNSFVPKPWKTLTSGFQAQQSVTEIVKGQLFKNSSGKRMEPLLLEKAKSGRRAHRIFEALRFQQDLRSSEKWIQQASDFILNLQHPPMKSILEVAEVEWGFSLMNQGRRWAGQIDLWGYFQKKLWVIDYKTGRSDFSELAQKQLQIYAESLFLTKQIPEGTPTQLVAIYPVEQKVICWDYEYPASTSIQP